MTDNPLIQYIPKHQLSIEEYREWIMDVETQLKMIAGSYDRHDDSDNLIHTFTSGLYIRKLFVPKGQIHISRVHLHEHPFVILEGDVSVYDGKNVVRLHGGYAGITKPGTKRITFTHEDTVWLTFHATNITSLDELDKDGVLTAPDFEGVSL